MKNYSGTEEDRTAIRGDDGKCLCERLSLAPWPSPVCRAVAKPPGSRASCHASPQADGSAAVLLLRRRRSSVSGRMILPLACDARKAIASAWPWPAGILAQPRRVQAQVAKGA
jgi:hypothetical protein